MNIFYIIVVVVVIIVVAGFLGLRVLGRLQALLAGGPSGRGTGAGHRAFGFWGL
jgi:hypothetical protein